MDTILPLYNIVYFVEGQSENEVFLIFFFFFFFFFFMRHEAQPHMATQIS